MRHHRQYPDIIMIKRRPCLVLDATARSSNFGASGSWYLGASAVTACILFCLIIGVVPGPVAAKTVNRFPVDTHLLAIEPERAALMGTIRDEFVDDAKAGPLELRGAADSWPTRALAGLPPGIVFPALVILLLGLVASLAALVRIHHGVRLPLRHLLREISDSEHRQSDRKHSLSEDVRRIGTEFAKMQSDLKALNATLEKTYELSALGTWSILPDQQSVRASGNMRMLMGFPEDEEVVRIEQLRDRILPEDKAGFDAALKRAVEDKRMAKIEFHAIDGAGNTRVFRALTGSDGATPEESPGAISGVIQDITDLRMNETALAQSLQLGRLAGEVARIGGWRFESATRMFTGSRETARIVGLEGDWISPIDEAMDRLASGEDRDRMERSFWTCVGTGAHFDEVAKFRKFDGDETWVRVIGEAEYDSTGKIVGAYGATQDIGEIIEANRASEEGRALIRTILDAFSDGFVILDCDGTIRYMNRSAHTLLDASDRDLVGGNIFEDLECAIGSQFGQIVRDARDLGEGAKYESEIERPHQWIRVAVYPTSSGLAVYLGDETEKRNIRERLRLLNAAVARVSDVVLITDAKTVDLPGPQVVFVNKAFIGMTGFAKEDIMGGSPRILQGPDTERDRLDDIRNAIETAQPIRTEITNYRKDGTSFIAELDINPVFDEAGVCTHFVSIQRDTTKRRADEELLRAREEQFRLANLASQDIVWDWDLKTGIITNFENSSDSIETISHLSDENSFEGRIENVLERIHPDDRLRITETLDAALAGDAQVWRCEYRVSSRKGDWRHVSDKAFIVREENGEPRRMVGAMSDVTEFKELDARLHHSQRLETVGQLTGGIAHDFNNLLTIILGNCDILLDDIDEDSDLRQLVQSIEDAAERGARVSNDLLAYSRRQPLELRPTDINDLIRKSSSLFGRAVNASVEIEYDLTDNPAIAFVDPYKLQSALLNLVINAMAAIEHEGCITIKTRSATVENVEPSDDFAPGDYVLVDVTDDGIGMPPEVAARAFEPFFTTKEPGVGTGMGLSSVYGLVKQSGGHAIIESELGKGTTVTLSLLAADNAEPIEQREDPQVWSVEGGGHRILVVEDDFELRAFVRTVLSRMGYRIVVADSGADALTILETDSDFDLIFTDIVMPGGVNGVQLAQQTQQLYPDIKVLLTSGYTRDALPKDRHLPSDIPMLYKPYRTIELIERVKQALLPEGHTDS